MECIDRPESFSQCSFYIVYCTLYIVHCTLYIVHCTLHIVHCTLYIVHCTLLYIIISKRSFSREKSANFQTRFWRWRSHFYHIIKRIPFPIDESLYFILVFGNLKFVKTGSSYGLSKLIIYTRPLAKVVAKQKRVVLRVSVKYCIIFYFTLQAVY